MGRLRWVKEIRRVFWSRALDKVSFFSVMKNKTFYRLIVSRLQEIYKHKLYGRPFG